MLWREVGTPDTRLPQSLCVKAPYLCWETTQTSRGVWVVSQQSAYTDPFVGGVHEDGVCVDREIARKRSGRARHRTAEAPDPGGQSPRERGTRGEDDVPRTRARRHTRPSVRDSEGSCDTGGGQVHSQLSRLDH